MKRRLSSTLAALILAATPFSASAGDLDVTNVPLGNVVSMLSAQLHENIVLGPKVDTTVVSVHLANVSPDAMLRAIEDSYGLREVRRDGYVILVRRDDPSFLENGYEMTVGVDSGQSAGLITFVKQLYPTITVSALDPRHIILAGDQATVVRAATSVAGFGGSDYETVHVSYIKPSDVLSYLRSTGLIDNTISVAANDAAGDLTVQGNANDLTRVRTAIENYDKQPRRAYFQVQVLEIQPTNDNSNIGIVWGSESSTTSQTTGFTSQSFTPGTAMTAFVNRTIPLAAQINALISHGAAKILANPGLGFNSNSPAMFNFSTSYPITINTGTAFVGGNVHYQDIGITLKIDGIIGPDQQITTALDATDSTIDGYDPIFNNPIIGKREVASTITVYPNESLILSGFDETQETSTETDVPILSKIPVLGQFFRDQQKTKLKLQIVFIITPLPVKTQQGATQQ
jgi:type II secretory pathway component GspD/PulD (secretin)